jgi:hypothetical protein
MRAQLDRLARIYLSEDTYPFPTEGQERVVVRVSVEHVLSTPAPDGG